MHNFVYFIVTYKLCWLGYSRLDCQLNTLFCLLSSFTLNFYAPSCDYAQDSITLSSTILIHIYSWKHLSTEFARMDTPATTIFRSGKMRHLFEGSYHSRMCLRTWTKCSVFDSIVRGHHVYKTVWTLFSDSDCQVLHELSPFSVIRTVS